MPEQPHRLTMEWSESDRSCGAAPACRRTRRDEGHATRRHPNPPHGGGSAKPVRVRATRATLCGVAIAGLIAVSGLAEFPASATSRPVPTHQQIEACVKAVTGDRPLTARQVTGCRAAVSQTFLSEKCPQTPSGYLIDLMGYRGVRGRAAHEWAIRAGRKPFLVRSDQTTQDVLDAAICG
jgi:hypothetical protein